MSSNETEKDVENSDEADVSKKYNTERQTLIASACVVHRPVVPGGAGGAMAPPNFGRSVNPISTKGGRLCPPNNTGTPGFSDLPTALLIKE